MSRTLGYPAQSRIAADSEMRLIIQLVQIGAASILLTVVTPCLWLIGTITLETSDQLPSWSVTKFLLKNYVGTNLTGYYIAIKWVCCKIES